MTKNPDGHRTLEPEKQDHIQFQELARPGLITLFLHYNQRTCLVISAGTLYRMPEGPSPILQAMIVTLETKRFIDEDHAEFIDIAGFFHEDQKSGANSSRDIAIDAFSCLDAGGLCVQA